MNNVQRGILLIEECNMFVTELEISPLDGYEYPLLWIVITLLDVWASHSVFNWLCNVYQSYL